MTQNVRTYIKKLNFKSRANLIENKVEYKNQLAAFLDEKTILSTSNFDAMQKFIQTGKYDLETFEKTSNFNSF